MPAYITDIGQFKRKGVSKFSLGCEVPEIRFGNAIGVGGISVVIDTYSIGKRIAAICAYYRIWHSRWPGQEVKVGGIGVGLIDTLRVSDGRIIVGTLTKDRAQSAGVEAASHTGTQDPLTHQLIGET